MKKYVLSTALSSLLVAPVFLSGCAGIAEMREITAERIARPAFMTERRLESNNMDFQVWERMHQREAPANLYIEGDGWAARGALDPTPKNPVALHLASRDKSQNLVYLSRPCQYKESQNHKTCAPDLWKNRRFSPEVIAAYNAALDDIKTRYDITEFNIIGYDGGANIAASLASTRDDVASLRTVAGALVPDLVYDTKSQPLDADSIKADDFAPSLATMPQHHFVGAGDNIVPASVYHSFRQSMGASNCVHYTFVQDADHTRGWVEKWPDLLNATTTCVTPPTPIALPPRPVDKDASHGMK